MRKKILYLLFSIMIFITLIGCQNKENQDVEKKQNEISEYEIKEDNGKVIIKLSESITQVFYHDGEMITDYEIYVLYEDSDMANEEAENAKKIQSNNIVDYVEARGKYVVYNYKEGNYNDITTYDELKKYAEKFNIIMEDNKEDNCNSIVGGSFDLIFNTNGGNSIDTIEICITCAPNTYKDLPIPVRQGYIFLGWYFDSKLENKVMVTSTKDIKSEVKLDEKGCIIGYESVTLYAKWEKQKQQECVYKNGGSFNLVFNTNGGNPIETMQVCIACAPNTYKDLPIPVREGYIFLDWYFDSELKNKVTVTNTKDIKPEVKLDEKGCPNGYESVTLYAQWLKNNLKDCVLKYGGSFNLVFDTNGGNLIDTIEICIACAPNTYKDLPIPVREGYTFSGWYFDSELKNNVSVTSTKDITPKVKLDKKGCPDGYEPITLYAKWEK